jgi:hypothetical protein
MTQNKTPQTQSESWDASRTALPRSLLSTTLRAAPRGRNCPSITPDDWDRPQLALPGFFAKQDPPLITFFNVRSVSGLQILVPLA